MGVGDARTDPDGAGVAQQDPPLDILHVIPDVGVGGAERFLVNLVAAQCDAGLHVGVVSLFDRRGNHLEALLDTLPVRRWHLGKRRGLDLRMVMRIERVIARTRPAVIHTHRYALQYAALSTFWHHRIPCVHTVQNLAARETTALGVWINRVLLRTRVRPVAIAERVAKSISDVYGIRAVATIPNGIPAGSYVGSPEQREAWREKEGIPSNVFAISCIGRLAPQKNQALLLRAARRVGDAGYDHFLVLLVGEGPDAATLAELTRSLGLERLVRFVGVRKEIVDILAASDLIVLPSRWEGNPLIIQEAMASGRPIVATAVGGVPELITTGMTGMLVPDDDVEALADAIIQVIGSPGLAAEMGSRAQARAMEQFDIQEVFRRYLRLYRECGAPL